MKKVVLYQHAGSQNHGCEALVRTISNILRESFDEVEIDLASFDKEQDIKYGVNTVVDKIYPHGLKIKRYNWNWWKIQIAKLLRSEKMQKKILTDFKWLKREFSPDCYIAIGGDNYCYNGGKTFYCYDEKIDALHVKKILLGCSIEPDDLTEKLIAVLKQYDLITVRETLTFNALKRFDELKRIELVPDTAFTLPTVTLPLPDNFQEGNTIGINISPLILEYEQVENATFDNYCALMDYIIKNTSYQIALIPHVVWKSSDDRIVVEELYRKYKDTSRVAIVNDCNCMELKGYISRCEMFIGARTHATIAAYSSCVPTLVVGYSVKAKGIAKDIFGTYEKYVIPVQSIKNKNDLIEAFEWLHSNRESIKKHLEEKMPMYIAEVNNLVEILRCNLE